MAIFRVHKETNYTTIDNNVFKNKELSYRATGLLTTMLSLPDDWDFTEMGLVTLKKESRETIRKTLKELEEYGYLTRIRNRDKKGRLTDTTYDIYETPMSKKLSESSWIYIFAKKGAVANMMIPSAETMVTHALIDVASRAFISEWFSSP